MVIALAVATFFENSYGTTASHRYIYGNVWFVALWTVLAVAGIFSIAKYKMWQRVPLLLVHASLVLILVGAGVTFFFGEKGHIHISEGETVDHFILEESRQSKPLGMDNNIFQLRLNSFEVSCYPGTDAPNDYVSRITLFHHGDSANVTISMNNILKTGGYRFYQTSFDGDHKGTWLSVSHDPWGIALTYAGYALFGISMILLLISKRETFHKLLRSSALQKMTGCLLLLVCLSMQLQANEAPAKLPILARSTADSLSTCQIVWQNRIAPFNTMACEVMKKLYGKTEYKGFSAEQVVGSLIVYPETWHFEPLIRIKNKELQQVLGISGQYASVSDFYREGEYKLSRYARTSSRQDAFGKAVSQAEEKVATILMLHKGTLFNVLPEDSQQKLPSIKVKAEVLYNKLNFTSLLFKINLTLGLLAFVLFVVSVVRGRRFRWINVLFYIQLTLSLVLLSVALALRWYISGHVPLSNGYETMMFVAWAISLIAFLFGRKSDMIPAAGLLLSGFMLLVSTLGSQNPQITNLMPVLMSPWLSSHVSLIMISYAMFGFMMLNGLAAVLLHFISKNSLVYEQKLHTISQILLYPAVGCLGMGIFLGAIWANVSWGRYWGWDPKEVWALITMMIYSIGFHTKTIRFLQKPLNFHIFCILAISVVLMTYFGVNVFFSGMHSYK